MLARLVRFEARNLANLIRFGDSQAGGGLDPINWAIIYGETESGVTIHVLDERIDLGDIFLQSYRGLQGHAGLMPLVDDLARKH